MHRARAFTLIELLVTLLATTLIVTLVAIYLAADRRESRNHKDGQQLRAIHQGLVLWAQCGEDSYVLPSSLDAGNTTLADDGITAKDTPGNMMSILIYNGFFLPEVCVSPCETNPRIQVCSTFAYTNPAAANKPSMALWDPSFRGTPDDGGIPAAGNLSYALTPAIGARRPKWSNDFQDTEAVIGSRGPAYIAQGAGADLAWQLAPSGAPGAPPDTPTGVGSRSLELHGSPTAWRGFVTYNDNHVAFENDSSPTATPFAFSALPQGSRKQLDNLFVNEDDATRAPCSETLEKQAGQNSNNFLRLWSAGKQHEHDQAWWDAWKRGDPSSGYRHGGLASITPWYD